MIRSAAILIFAISALLLSGCSGKMTPEEKAERARKEAAQALRDAASPEAMWYRFTFDADYQGEPVKLDQMVYCPKRSFSGGSLGQSTGFSIRQQHPMTIAQKMDDGSQVLVRIPDMCKRYRKYKLGDGFQNGWISQGPFEVMPYVIWSDKVPKAERIEGYVSPTYYDHPEARLKNPKGKVHLLSLGSHPKNFADVLKQEHAIPYSPNPWINPGKPNSDWFARNGRYNDPDNQFVSLYQIPIVDMNAYAEKFKRINPDVRDGKFDEDRDFSDPNIAAYHPSSASEMSNRLVMDASYISPNCVGGADSDAMRGRPIQSNMPFDPQDYGGPQAVRVRIKGSPDSKDPKLAKDLQFTRQMQSNCRDRLAKLQSFEIANGRFDASGTIPGILTYHRWGSRERPDISPFAKEAGFQMLQKKGLVTSEGDYKFTIDGHNFLYPFQEYGYTIGSATLFENKRSGQWYVVGMKKKIFAGEGENNHF